VEGAEQKDIVAAVDLITCVGGETPRPRSLPFKLPVAAAGCELIWNGKTSFMPWKPVCGKTNWQAFTGGAPHAPVCGCPTVSQVACIIISLQVGWKLGGPPGKPQTFRVTGERLAEINWLIWKTSGVVVKVPNAWPRHSQAQRVQQIK
jgi:hypothetical protein